MTHPWFTPAFINHCYSDGEPRRLATYRLDVVRLEGLPYPHLPYLIGQQCVLTDLRWGLREEESSENRLTL